MIERSLGDDAGARRHLQEALRTNPRFSPARVPPAKEALASIGQPPAGGPENMQPVKPWVAPDLPKAAKPTPPASAAKPKPKPSPSPGPGKPGPARV